MNNFEGANKSFAMQYSIATSQKQIIENQMKVGYKTLFFDVDKRRDSDSI